MCVHDVYIHHDSMCMCMYFIKLVWCLRLTIVWSTQDNLRSLPVTLISTASEPIQKLDEQGGVTHIGAVYIAATGVKWSRHFFGGGQTVKQYSRAHNLPLIDR